MTYLASIFFALTYPGMALGRIPGLRIDRSGIAMVVAVIIAAIGAIPTDELASAVHFPTLLLLGGLMVLSARVGASGFYDAAAVWIAGQAGRPLRLLALTIVVGGALSAFLVNDIVVFAMTPLCALVSMREVSIRGRSSLDLQLPATSVSAATLIGNPQNILIGQVGGIGFWPYFADAVTVSLIGLAVSFVCIVFVWRTSLAAPAVDAPLTKVAFNRLQTGICGIGVIVLLALFATSLPREVSALLVAACLILSRATPLQDNCWTRSICHCSSCLRRCS